VPKRNKADVLAGISKIAELLLYIVPLGLPCAEVEAAAGIVTEGNDWTGAINQPFVSVGVKSARLSTMETRIINRLSLGKKEVYDLLVVAVPDRLNQDVDGMMPTSLFHSIFISHRGRFVILNPSFSRQTVKAAGIQSSREPKPSNE
jgi:hypothetical protein